jgi:hypothetical protein
MKLATALFIGWWTRRRSVSKGAILLTDSGRHDDASVLNGWSARNAVFAERKDALHVTSAGTEPAMKLATALFIGWWTRRRSVSARPAFCRSRRPRRSSGSRPAAASRASPT